MGFVNAQTKKDERKDEPKEEILIFRTSSGIELQAEGFFRFQVSSFSPILVVKVNGFAQMVTGDQDWAEFEIPFYLDEGKNLFTVFVQTKNGQKEKDFVVSFEPQTKKEIAPPPLKGVVMLGQTNSDNILNSQDGSSKTSAAKNDFLFSVGYSFLMDEESSVALSIVLKFDHYQNRSLAAEEVLFRQFNTEYINKNLFGINFISGIGQTVVSLKSVNTSEPIKTGEFSKDVQSLFLFLSGSKKWGKFSSTFKIQIDSQDKQSNDSEDGTLMLSSLNGKMRFGKFRLNARLDSQSTTFKDTVKDYESTTIDTGITYSLSPWVFGFNYNNFDQKYKNADPGTGISLKTNKGDTGIDTKYAFSGSTIFGFGMKQIKQDSNDSTKVYSENQMFLQYIWMF